VLVIEIDPSPLQHAPRKDPPSRDRPPGAVTKADIARAICARTPGVSLKAAAGLIDAIVEEIILALASDQILRLHCFGSFSVRVTSERPGRNPRTGVAVTVIARRVVVFRASSILIAATANGSRA